MSRRGKPATTGPARIAASVVVAAMSTAFLLPGLTTPAHAARVKRISIADASIVEGDVGQKTLSFRVTWTGAKGGAQVSVSYSTADGSATAGSDYTAATGFVTLSNGCRCGTISVPTLGDTVTEGTEAFTVNLFNPVNATLADAEAIGTIYDNEGPPAFVISDATADEAAGPLSFSVILTNASASTQTVNFTTADGTATAGGDYSSTSGMLTFTPGQTTKTVPVTILDDALNEADESLLVNLSSGSLAVTDSQAVGTIVNDDAEPTVSVVDASASESDGALSFTVTLSTASGQEVDVDYATSDGSATAGADYASASGTAVIPAGATSTSVDVVLIGDATYETDEDLTILLTAPFNASILDGVAMGTITDDDAVPTVSIADTTVSEADPKATFPVTLDHPSAMSASVEWTTSNGTATAGLDYVAASGTVVFDPGETSRTVSVDMVPDDALEPAETFAVSLSAPSGAQLGSATASGTITNDDRAATTLTLQVVKTRTRLGGRGVLEPATADSEVTVTLFRKRSGEWVRISRRAVGVRSLGDRDGDGMQDAAYKALFKRPRAGRYTLRVVFPGNSTLLPTRTTVRFRLR
jgi:large repetitive protein